MRVKLTTEVVRRLPLDDVDLYDTKYPGLVLRCRATGAHSYRVNYGRGRWVTLGRADVLTPDAARVKARDVLASIAKGHDPRAARAAAKADTTFKAFLDDTYGPWAREHQKRGAETVQRLRSVFEELLDTRLSEITAWRVEKWRTARMKREPRPKPATLNSHVTMLKAALAKAVAWRLLPAQPLTQVKPLTADRLGRVRHLTPDEERRLRDALIAREGVRRASRERANAWRRERGYPEYPASSSDHLRPIVILALNTGLRKGELFGLEWRDVDLGRGLLTVRGEGAKSGQTRHIPLNEEALRVLADWRAVAEGSTYVFPGRTDGEPLDDIKKAWAPVVKAAKLTAFTFHDLRHTFASKLAMTGTDLNTVRELLGHADLKMTLRYAHLAPEHKAAAVARLVRR